MSRVFILQNQHQYFLSKRNEWVDGNDASILFRTPFKDEAVNQMVELSAKDHTERIRVLPCSLDDKQQPTTGAISLPEPDSSSADSGEPAPQVMEPSQITSTQG